MKFAAVAILATIVAADAEADAKAAACKIWKDANTTYDCSSGSCKAKDQDNATAVAGEANMTTAYKAACDSAVSNAVTIGALAAAAAALAF